MPSQYNWDEYKGFGNPMRKGFEPAMLSAKGAKVTKRKKLQRGQYSAYEPVEIVYDKRFVIRKLISEVIKPLAIKQESFIELINECFSEIRAEQLTLFGGDDDNVSA